MEEIPTETIRVACRMRPKTEKEAMSSKSLITIENAKKVNIDSKSKIDQKSFTFDYVADDSVSQQDFFQEVGLSISETCLEGFNGTVIFYGQTGNAANSLLHMHTQNSNYMPFQEPVKLIPPLVTKLQTKSTEG